jgi:biopolymer transport protein ExbD
MRHVLYVVLILIGSGNSVIGAEPASKLSVEVFSNREVKFATVAAVLSAIGDNLGDKPDVVLSVQATEGLAVKVRVSSDTPYRRLAGLLAAIRHTGVDNITLAEPDVD